MPTYLPERLQRSQQQQNCRNEDFQLNLIDKYSASNEQRGFTISADFFISVVRTCYTNFDSLTWRPYTWCVENFSQTFYDQFRVKIFCLYKILMFLKKLKESIKKRKWNIAMEIKMRNEIIDYITLREALIGTKTKSGKSKNR